MQCSQLHFEGFGMNLNEKIDNAIKLLREFEPSALDYSSDGYYLAFSGGKDSVVIKDIAIKSGVKFTANYNVTTIDPPELTRFIKHHHPDVVWHRPKVPLLKMIQKKGVPTRRLRWCCHLYKEQGGKNRVKIIGVRAAESPRRASQWQEVTAWGRSSKKDKNTIGWVVLPILYWSDNDVWQYIRENALPYCSLYDEGIKRIGCVGCPMTKRHEQFQRWPHFERLWRKAVNEKFNNFKKLPKETWPRHVRQYKTGDDWFDWWLSNTSMPKENDCQMGMF